MEYRKLYIDMAEINACISVWIKDTELIQAGTTIYSMSSKHKSEEYERFAKEYDIHFIFDDNIPLIDFYTIPRVDIFATDGKGGYIGTIGQTSDLENDAPICYIDKNKQCYLICKNGKDFLQKVTSWKASLELYEEIKFYLSKSEAMLENEFYEGKIGRLDVQRFSKTFSVRRMGKEDAQMIYDMTCRNLQYYEYCGKQNTLEDIHTDLEITPPGKEEKDKYYVGFFKNDSLVAVMDLIDGFPDDKTAYIGFFMMNVDYQGKGVGTKIISGLLEYLGEMSFSRVRLGYDKDNPQSSHFWKKQQFLDVKEVFQNDGIVVVAEREL